MQEYQFFLIPYCPAFRASQTKSVISANILCYCYYQFWVSNIAVFVVVKVNDTLFLNTQIVLVLCIHVCRWKIADLRVFFALSNSYYTIRREGWTFLWINSFGKKINRAYLPLDLIATKSKSCWYDQMPSYILESYTLNEYVPTIICN